MERLLQILILCFGNGEIGDLDALARDMGSQKYAVRARASRRAERLHPAYALELRKTACNHADPEVARRCLLAAKSIESRRLVLILDALEPFPMIDALWYDAKRDIFFHWRGSGELSYRWELYGHYLNMVGADNSPYRNYRLASRWMFSDLLRDGKSTWDSYNMWLYMHRQDHAWYRRYPMEWYKAPKNLPYRLP